MKYIASFQVPESLRIKKKSSLGTVGIGNAQQCISEIPVNHDTMTASSQFTFQTLHANCQDGSPLQKKFEPVKTKKI